MPAKTDYYRGALARATANRILLAKVSAIPFSNDSTRAKIIHAAKDLQNRTQSNLRQLLNAKQDEWLTHMIALDRDFKKLEDTLEKLRSKPPSGPCRESVNINHTTGP